MILFTSGDKVLHLGSRSTFFCPIKHWAISWGNCWPQVPLARRRRRSPRLRRRRRGSFFSLSYIIRCCMLSSFLNSNFPPVACCRAQHRRRGAIILKETSKPTSITPVYPPLLSADQLRLRPDLSTLTEIMIRSEFLYFLACLRTKLAGTTYAYACIVATRQI